ncbi:hypothetical protein pb186bvf_019811 [Paramecium bursaria]
MVFKNSLKIMEISPIFYQSGCFKNEGIYQPRYRLFCLIKDDFPVIWRLWGFYIVQSSQDSRISQIITQKTEIRTRKHKKQECNSCNVGKIHVMDTKIFDKKLKQSRGSKTKTLRTQEQFIHKKLSKKMGPQYVENENFYKKIFIWKLYISSSKSGITTIKMIEHKQVDENTEINDDPYHGSII